MNIVSQAQKKGGVCAFIDAEHALDPEYAKKLGVKIDDLLISQPDTGEQALEITESLVRSGGIDVVVIDSVAALTPKAEIEGEMGLPIWGSSQADVASFKKADRHHRQVQNHRHLHQSNQNANRRLFRQSGNDHRRQGFEILLLGQNRSPKSGPDKKGEEVIGNRVKVKIVKNKVAAPFPDGRV